MGALQKPITIPRCAGSFTSRTHDQTRIKLLAVSPMTKNSGPSIATGGRSSPGATSAIQQTA